LERWIQKGERPARSANQHQHQKGTSIAKRPNSQIYLCIHVANKSQIYLCIHVANKSPSGMAPSALALFVYCSTELEELHNLAPLLSSFPASKSKTALLQCPARRSRSWPAVPKRP
jgi:hypothetical protein